MTATDASTTRRLLLSPLGPLGLLAALVIAALYVGTMFPPGFVAGTSSYWQTQVEDVAQHLVGYTVFLHEPWKLPLLRVEGINWPTGAALTFTDSIPLLAVAMKLLGPWAPADPFGYWIALCFLLQSAATWWALREARSRSWFVLVLAAFLMVGMPALSLRLGHAALMAFFLIVAALALYIRDRRRGAFGALAWAGLVFAAFYIHVYLAVMVAGVMAASGADEARNRRSAWPLALALAALMPVMLSWPLTLGATMGPGSGSGGGFGYFSMNLLAPFAGGTILQLPFYQPGGDGFEGRNTLGLGVLLLLLLAFIWRRRPANPAFSAPPFGPFLVAALAAMAVYALSNKIFVSSFLLLRWDVPAVLAALVDTFRSSARFFWPLACALVLWGCLWLEAAITRRVVLALLCVTLGFVQQIDLIHVRQSVMSTARRPAKAPLDIARMGDLIGPAEHVLLFPKAFCPVSRDQWVLPVALAVAARGATLNTGWVARGPRDCAPPAEEIAASDPATSAYVFFTGLIAQPQARAMLPAGVACQPLAQWLVCRQGLAPTP